MIVLDTHALLWMDADDPALGAKSRDLIARAWRQSAVAVSAISFWECAMLATSGRIVIPISVQEWRLELLDSGLAEIPVDGRVALQAVGLDLPHKDPADRFIAATAQIANAMLITADARLLEWPSDLVRADARS